MRVLVQLRNSPVLHTAAVEGQPAGVVAEALSAIEGVVVDTDSSVVQLPSLEALGPPRSAIAAARLLEPQSSVYLVRGTIPDEPLGGTYQRLNAHPDVVGVFSDPAIESTLTCGGDPPVGDDNDVAALLDVPTLAAAGMDGSGVYVAVVDTGINIPYLRSRGRMPNFDVPNSWTPGGVATTPGAHPVNHGCMCAFDLGIAAPSAILLDCAVLLSTRPGATVMTGLLSDAVLAYGHLLRLVSTGVVETLVVTNSWGMFDPAWDFPPGHPGNYSDNPAHPFNVIVASLERAGADICFAAGNCGLDCPDGRCAFGATRPICGANSHESVLTVAGIDTTRTRVGYSSQGPGRLEPDKPDICGYTHFTGSRVYPADSGTSAACPVVAGLLAALRTSCPPSQLSPVQLRDLVAKTAVDLSGKCFDYDHGWGYPNATALAAAIGQVVAGAPAPVP